MCKSLHYITSLQSVLESVMSVLTIANHYFPDFHQSLRMKTPYDARYQSLSHFKKLKFYLLAIQTILFLYTCRSNVSL